MRQSINLNANLPLDNHEFARLCFANSRNDTHPQIHIDCHAVFQKTARNDGHFLSYRAFARKRSIHKFKKRVLNSVDISLTLNMTIWIFRSQSSLKMTKSAVIVLKTLFARHCEQAKRAWQSTKKQCYHLDFKQKHKFCHINEIVILSFC